ncbi:ABC-three component system protein [Saccharopolyspora gloriosae]|uniref:ABC-three component system protein n=1 Tax=Saccharopolyspora gloriosae TaxID=455344 RepID=UPI001FB61425|nr:ABC-three component system protein [Saccharopolyspora gloriosae]
MAKQQVDERAALTEMPLPADSTPAVALDGPPIPPVGRIRLYSPDEWEEFIREWATAIKEDYVQIKLLGGAGDRGTDIVGFKTDRQFEGPWDCFQAKHYDKPLSFSDAAAEMIKVFVAALDGVYRLPRTYQFLAPRGLSTQFNMMISNPTALRENFLDLLGKGKAPSVKALARPILDAVRALAAETDFAMFRSVEVLDALTTHSRTRWHTARFATALPERGDSKTPPEEYAPEEARYLQQLLAVYAERAPDKITTLDSVANVPKLDKHLQQQRVRFFRAESLKAYSVGAVPPGTFEKLQGDIHAGVIDIAQDDHPDGYTRLGQVLTQVGSLDLNRHKLIGVTEIDDRKGVCHQLANDDRLTWMEEP